MYYADTHKGVFSEAPTLKELISNIITWCREWNNPIPNIVEFGSYTDNGDKTPLDKQRWYSLMHHIETEI